MTPTEIIAARLEPFIISDHRLCVSTDWTKQRAAYIARQLVEGLGLDEVIDRLAEAERAVYANTGPSPVLVAIRRAQVLLKAT